MYIYYINKTMAPVKSDDHHHTCSESEDHHCQGCCSCECCAKYSPSRSYRRNEPETLQEEREREERERELKCGLCTDDLKEDYRLERCDTCFHTYHRTCLNPWIRNPPFGLRVNTCPLCQRPCKTPGYIRWLEGNPEDEEDPPIFLGDWRYQMGAR